MSDFKVGDRVRVADEKLTYRYGGNLMSVQEPEAFRGKVATIIGGPCPQGDWLIEVDCRCSDIAGKHLSPVPNEEPAVNSTPVREATLTQAANLISGDRAKDYGDAAESFTRLAALWSPILGVDVTPEQVALCLTQLKISRLIVTPAHTDSWVDAAGYIALGSEIAARGRDADG